MDTTGGNQPIYHKKTFENIPEEKRRRILAAAIGEFANKGFDNANINVIASKAGVSVGSLYKYFNTKQDLFLTAVHHGISILEETLGPLSQADMDVRDKLELIIRTVQTTSRQLEDLIKLYNEMTSENNAELVRLISQDMETVSAAVYTQVIAQAQQEGLIRRDVDPRMFAFLLDNLFTNLQFSYACGYYQERFKIYAGEDILSRDDFVVEQMLKFIEGAFTTGLGQEAPARRECRQRGTPGPRGGVGALESYFWRALHERTDLCYHLRRGHHWRKNLPVRDRRGCPFDGGGHAWV